MTFHRVVQVSRFTNGIVDARGMPKSHLLAMIMRVTHV